MGLGQGLYSVLRGGCMELLSSLRTSPYMPLRSGQNELTGKAPCSHGDEPGAQETAGSTQHGHRLHHPSPTGEPRNRAGKE